MVTSRLRPRGLVVGKVVLGASVDYCGVRATFSGGRRGQNPFAERCQGESRQLVGAGPTELSSLSLGWGGNESENRAAWRPRQRANSTQSKTLHPVHAPCARHIISVQ